MTERAPVEALVITVLLTKSMSVAPAGPTVFPLSVVAVASVNSTFPKFANGTSLPPTEKSSTIHSASCSHRALEEVMDLVTVLPLELFVITAVPALVEVAVTVRVTESPGEKEMPEKS